MKKVFLFFLIGFFLMSTSTVSAKEPVDEGYIAGVTAKLMRGITNTMLGLAIEPVAEAERRNEIYYVESGGRSSIPVYLSGVPKGVARGFQRTFVGIYEVATFYVPQEEILEPTYMLEDKDFDVRPHLRGLAKEKTFQYEDLDREPVYL